MINSNRYYNNGKIQSTLKLNSTQNRYDCKIYFQNGLLAGEGNVIMLHKKPLKFGSWLYYKNDGSLYAYTEYALNKKTEKEVLIKKQIIPKEYHLIKKRGKIEFIDKKNDKVLYLINELCGKIGNVPKLVMDIVFNINLLKIRRIVIDKFENESRNYLLSFIFEGKIDCK